MGSGGDGDAAPHGARGALHAAFLHDLTWGDKYEHALRTSLGLSVDDHYLGYQHDSLRLAGGAAVASGDNLFIQGGNCLWGTDSLASRGAHPHCTEHGPPPNPLGML